MSSCNYSRRFENNQTKFPIIPKTRKKKKTDGSSSSLSKWVGLSNKSATPPKPTIDRKESLPHQAHPAQAAPTSPLLGPKESEINDPPPPYKEKESA
jgi:hypothetical protein